MKMSIRLKVRGKLLVPILSMVFLGIMGLVFFVYSQSATLLEEEIRSGIVREAEAASRSMQDWIQGRESDLRNWARNRDHAAALQGRFNGVQNSMNNLAGKVTDFDYYESVNLMDMTGTVISSGDPERIGLELGSREYFQTAKNGQIALSPPLRSKVSGNPIFVIAVPVRSESGEVLGVLGGVIKIDRMTSIFTEQVKIGKTGYAFVLDSTGTVIGHPDRSFILELNVADTEYGKAALREKNGSYKYWFEQQNQWKIMGYNEVPISGWIVAVTAPLGEIMAPLVQVRNLALLGGLVTLLLVALVVFYAVGKITTVLRECVDYLKELAQGNVDEDVPENRLRQRDEMGDLARGFQAMVDAQRARADLAQAIAQGELARRVDVSSDKDRLGRALDTMVRRLNEIIGQIGTAAAQVQDGSGQVSESSQALSQGATEQASSLEEITSSITEISSQTRTNADNASQASRLASEARDAAQTGDREMGSMVSAMEDINESSQAISKIIKVIDEIAFQTNLLALNAAVEAARAGKHGKGFAVVAEEVRNLASRSAKAAQETAQLIEGSVAKVGSGSEIATQTAQSLQQIVEKITTVADIVAEIAAASDEQAKGVTQINQGLSQIDQVTQQNTANAEETASAAEELSSQAVEMRRLVGQFHLAGDGRPGQGAPRKMSVRPARPTQSLPPSGGQGGTARPKPAPAAGSGNKQSQGSRDASNGIWGAEAAKPAAPKSEPGSRVDTDTVNPEEIISLDDDEFGRY
ncbi:methyl-accepting chemotaxis protein [Paucidesulfovibrio gracilis DSM 16080]|uniref:Methyl-accepting chemotaxis protein n=1 Tax=Paucidesulfovibrio gracilis DSM 16080 TaxID=1121449 RepID=A0A1T4XLU8_9BACT|nr:methyl-accepting chemotaxis protein [Paucidesulfovibrio gracilis]SKA90507.1 methyl-accepting chemotaxis protein [Paucidesulfovibrio gracilis DSM 16080]